MHKFNPENLDDIKASYRGKTVALVPHMGEGYFSAGVAVANSPGYVPLPVSWCSVEQGPGAYDQFCDYLDAINQSLFHLNIHATGTIIASTMVVPQATALEKLVRGMIDDWPQVILEDDEAEMNGGDCCEALYGYLIDARGILGLPTERGEEAA